MILSCTHRPRYGDSGLIPSDLSRGLISAWLFNESGGNYTYDLLRGVQGLLDGDTAPTWAADGLAFLGQRQRVDTGLVAYDNGTIHVRYRRVAAGADYHFILCSYDSTFRLFDYAGGTLFVRIGGDNSYVSVNIADYATHDITLTWTGGVVTLYVDGIKQAWADGGTYSSTTSDSIAIGGRPYSADYYCAGVIPLCYFFNRVLTSGEIRQLAGQPYSLFYSKSENLIRSIWSVSSGTPEYVSLTISSESDISVSAFRRRFLSLLVASESGISSSASRKRFSSANIESVSDTFIDVLRRRYLSLAIEAESDLWAAVYRKRYAECLIESVSDVSVYIPSATVQVLIESVSDIAITAMRKRSVVVNIASVSDVDVLAKKIVYAALMIESESDIDISMDIVDLSKAILAAVELQSDAVTSVLIDQDIIIPVRLD